MLEDGTTVEVEADGRVSPNAAEILAQKGVTVIRLPPATVSTPGDATGSSQPLSPTSATQGRAMGQYVDENLLPGEHFVHRGVTHWFVFVPGAVFLIIGFSLFGGNEFAVLLILAGLVMLVRAWLVRNYTELAVTTKRVIAKTGFIRRNTIELNHSKVESFKVDQGVVGRVFGFGTVSINGTGGVRTPIPMIKDPLQFRRKAMEAISSVYIVSAP